MQGLQQVDEQRTEHIQNYAKVRKTAEYTLHNAMRVCASTYSYTKKGDTEM